MNKIFCFKCCVSSCLKVTGFYFRKPAVNVSSTKIESLGVDLADIEDDIVDEGTDAEADNTHQVTHKNHMKSQPIGKLFIEQTRMS